MDEWFSSTGAKGAEETRRERWMNSTQDSWNSKIYWRFCSREVQILLFYGRCGTGMWQLTDIFVLRSWIKLYSLRFRVNFILYPASIVRISSVLPFQRQTQLLSFIHQSYLLSGILSARFIHTPNTFHGSVEINAIISKLSLVSLNFNQRPETHRVKSTQRSWRSSIHEISVTIRPSKNRSREIRNLRVVDRGQSSRADRYRPDYANFSKRGLDVGKQKVWISKSRRAYHGSPAREGPLIPVPLSPRESKSGVSHAFPTRSRRSLHAPLPGATRTRLTFTGTGWNFDGAREEPKHEGELAEFPEDSNGFGFPADVSDRRRIRHDRFMVARDTINERLRSCSRGDIYTCRSIIKIDWTDWQ